MFFANWIKNICFSYGIVGSFLLKLYARMRKI